jgi:hypothetical protein
MTYPRRMRQVQKRSANGLIGLSLAGARTHTPINSSVLTYGVTGHIGDTWEIGISRLVDVEYTEDWDHPRQQGCISRSMSGVMTRVSTHR